MILCQQKGAKKMAIAKYIVFSLLGFGGGIVISGAVFAFIAIIGVVPRLTQNLIQKNILSCMRKL